MCGIAGCIDPNLDKNRKTLVGQQMLKRIVHRGPDATKSYADDFVFLGHNRLSIIDLSEEADQPFVCDNLIMVYNGEVYNYLEIKIELEELGYNFITKSDTEVILKSYKEWGKTCVDRFVGMWALAIYDSNTKELFCSRDRFGIKPFYYIFENDAFYFASEIKAFYDLPIFNPKLNLNQVSRGLNLGWISYKNETYFEQVKALEPAQNLVLESGKISLHTYWSLQKKEIKLSYDEAVASFKEKFLESVTLHLRSDVKVGACLSGGIDSSALVSAISTLDPLPLESFTIFYEGKESVDERPWVKEVIKEYPNINPHYFTPSDTELKGEFSKILYHQDAPLPGSSPVSQYFLMQLAGSNKIKVVIDGQGSDEYLLGYMHFYFSVYAHLIKKWQFGEVFKTLRAHCKTQQLNFIKTIQVVAKSIAKLVLGEQVYKRYEYRNRYAGVLKEEIKSDLWKSFENGNPIDSVVQNALFQDILPTLLHFEDRNSMAYSIESRVPFLDHRLVEFAYNLPYNYKLNKGITKKILRDALQGILTKKISERTDKKGFVTPGETRWLRGPFKHLLESVNLTHLDDICNMDKVLTLINAFNNGDDSNAPMVWRIVALNEWRKTIV